MNNIQKAFAAKRTHSMNAAKQRGLSEGANTFADGYVHQPNRPGYTPGGNFTDRAVGTAKEMWGSAGRGLSAVGDFFKGPQTPITQPTPLPVATVPPPPPALSTIGTLAKHVEDQRRAAAELDDVNQSAPAPVMSPEDDRTNPLYVPPELRPDPSVGLRQAFKDGYVPKKKVADGQYPDLSNGSASLVGPGTPRSDSITAHLSKGEAVLPEKTVSAVGGPEVVHDLITSTTGKAPSTGMREGVRAAYGIDGSNRQSVSNAAARDPRIEAGRIANAKLAAELAAQQSTAQPAAASVNPAVERIRNSSTFSGSAPAATTTAPAAQQSASVLSRAREALNKQIPSPSSTGMGERVVKGAAKVGSVAKPVAGALKSAFIPATLAATATDTWATPTSDYEKRFNLESNATDASLGGMFRDMGVRGLGAASDLGNAMTLGQAGRLFRDRQEGDVSTAQPAVQPTAAQPVAAADNAEATGGGVTYNNQGTPGSQGDTRTAMGLDARTSPVEMRYGPEFGQQARVVGTHVPATSGTVNPMLDETTRYQRGTTVQGRSDNRPTPTQLDPTRKGLGVRDFSQNNMDFINAGIRERMAAGGSNTFSGSSLPMTPEQQRFEDERVAEGRRVAEGYDRTLARMDSEKAAATEKESIPNDLGDMTFGELAAFKEKRRRGEFDSTLAVNQERNRTAGLQAGAANQIALAGLQEKYADNDYRAKRDAATDAMAKQTAQRAAAKEDRAEADKWFEDYHKKTGDKDIDAANAMDMNDFRRKLETTVPDVAALSPAQRTKYKVQHEIMKNVSKQPWYKSDPEATSDLDAFNAVGIDYSGFGGRDNPTIITAAGEFSLDSMTGGDSRLKKAIIAQATAANKK